MPETIYNFLFGDRAEQIKELETEIEAVQKKKLSEGVLGIGEYTEEDRAKELAELTAALMEVKGTEHDGGFIKRTGMYQLRQGESVLTPTQLVSLQKGMQVLAGSQALEQAGRGGAPVVVNNINNSQSNPVISNQATTLKVPDSVRSSDPTFALARQSFSY